MPKMKMTFNGRWPLMEEDHEISKVEYISNQRLDFPQTLDLTSGDQTQKMLKWRLPPMEEDLKVLNIEYLSNQWWYLTQVSNYVIFKFLRGKLEENSEEISSVALLSPACSSVLSESSI